MKVYALKADGNYGGGMAIVAAPNPRRARQLATGIDKTWHTRYHSADAEELPITYKGKRAKVLVHYETGE